MSGFVHALRGFQADFGTAHFRCVQRRGGKLMPSLSPLMHVLEL